MLILDLYFLSQEMRLFYIKTIFSIFKAVFSTILYKTIFLISNAKHKL